MIIALKSRLVSSPLLLSWISTFSRLLGMFPSTAAFSFVYISKGTFVFVYLLMMAKIAVHEGLATYMC